MSYHDEYSQPFTVAATHLERGSNYLGKPQLWTCSLYLPGSDHSKLRRKHVSEHPFVCFRSPGFDVWLCHGMWR